MVRVVVQPQTSAHHRLSILPNRKKIPGIALSPSPLDQPARWTGWLTSYVTYGAGHLGAPLGSSNHPPPLYPNSFSTLTQPSPASPRFTKVLENQRHTNNIQRCFRNNSLLEIPTSATSEHLSRHDSSSSRLQNSPDFNTSCPP